MSKVFCTSCGAENLGGNYCRQCGSKLVIARRTARGTSLTPEQLVTAVDKLRASATIWLIIGIIQCLTGVAFLIGVWNIIQSGRARRNADLFATGQADIVTYYRGISGGRYFLAGIVNLLLGAVVGIIGAIYDASIRRYVLSAAPVYYV